MDNIQNTADSMLAMLYTQARAQFGSAIKGKWFYGGDCPSCQREINTIKVKGQDALSLNAFIYRPRGVLIGYFLCARCAKEIFREAKKHPKTKTPLHTKIEETLINAYLAYLASLAA